MLLKSTASLLLILGSLCTSTNGAIITRLQVPRTAYHSQSEQFRCEYDTEGEPLHSVRWYKDREEIVRCDNRDKTMTTFHFRDLFIRTNGTFPSGTCNFQLDLINDNSAGVYSCEVNLDYPTFFTFVRSEEFSVTEKPRKLSR